MRYSARSAHDVPPPAMMRRCPSPETTSALCGRMRISGWRWLIASQNAQCVVASWPSRRPALANSSVPEQAEARIAPFE